MNSPARVAVIGGGPAGLIAAETLAGAGVAVVVHDRMPSAGRKLLMAGRGGLNLTHGEDIERFLARYGDSRARLEAAIRAFPPEALRAWADALGQETFVGSSGRVFPKALKASPLLRAWSRRLESQGVRLASRDRWLGWSDDGALRFEPPGGIERTERVDATILALGGASWPRLGSDGGWAAILAGAGVGIATLRPANCGFLVDWSDDFRARFAGQPLKRIAAACGDAAVRGEAMVTARGIEGGAIYAISGRLREAIDRDGSALLDIDLLPDRTREDIAGRIAAAGRRRSRSTILRTTLGLSPVAVALLRESVDGPADDAAALADRIKRCRLRLTDTAPIDRAISTAGGVAWDGIDETFMLRPLPGVFVAGEMIDWDAPTGGYLLQACFATGRAAASGALAWLGDIRAK